MEEPREMHVPTNGHVRSNGHGPVGYGTVSGHDAANGHDAAANGHGAANGQGTGSRHSAATAHTGADGYSAGRSAASRHGAANGHGVAEVWHEAGREQNGAAQERAAADEDWGDTDQAWDGAEGDWDGADQEWDGADENWDGADEDWDGVDADDTRADDGAPDEPEHDRPRWEAPEPVAAVEAREPVAPVEPPSRAAGVRRAVGSAHAATEPRRRRRSARSGSTLRRAGWIAVGVAALVGIALAAVVMFPGLVRGTSTPVPVAAPAAAAAPVESAFGERVERTDGWTIEIDKPSAVHDRDTLPADADRGVTVDVVLTNTGSQPRGTVGWTIKALVGSTPVDIKPSTVPSRTVRPGSSLTFSVTVPMPKSTTDLQLEAAPTGGVPSLFVGTA